MQKNFIVTETRFGNGEIGNWGLPNKPDESYAIRNLNGAMDEFFSARIIVRQRRVNRPLIDVSLHVQNLRRRKQGVCL